jgi:hypothetical protein
VDESATIAANLTVTGNATITTNLTVNGNTTLGNADTDIVTVTADVASNLIPSADNTYDLGATGSEWKDLYITGTANIDSLVADTAAISAGTATLSAATIITANGGIVTLQRNDSAIITGETLGAVDFQAPNVAGGGNATLVTASIKAVSDTTFDATNNKTSLLLQTANADVVATRVEVTGEGHVLPGVDDAYDLGSNTKEWRNLYIDGVANIDSLVADTADINGGTIDGATIATSDITVEAGKTLNVSAGTLTLANDQISGDKVEGGTINAITINTLDSTTVNATTVDTTNIEVTNLKAKNGTTAGSIADSTGVVTLASSVLTTTDINGGTIDGTTIGATTASTIAGTTGTFSGNLTVDTNTLFVDATNDRVGVGTTSPNEKLDVRGGVLIGDVASSINYNGMILDYNTSTREARLVVGATSGGNSFFTFTTANGGTEGERMRIDNAGAVTITNLSGVGSRAVNASAAGLLSAASDSRLKEEVPEALIPSLAEVMLLKPRAYKWLDDIEKRGENAAVEIGFFADEVKDIIPSAAPMGNDGYYGFYDRSVIAALTNAIQEQQAMITSLVKAVQEQQALINSLEARLSALEAQ